MWRSRPRMSSQLMAELEEALEDNSDFPVSLHAHLYLTSDNSSHHVMFGTSLDVSPVLSFGLMCSACMSLLAPCHKQTFQHCAKMWRSRPRMSSQLMAELEEALEDNSECLNAPSCQIPVAFLPPPILINALQQLTGIEYPGGPLQAPDRMRYSACASH
ncbi:hypothetical protein T265_07314 [Opisthorchis viverrini]|uniref:Uncharacterized protein n=1 Tax=Opisthorchis viverrini TaxID=6198 RepID=A0A074ZHL6_OPIVI|nr:hypothetical protein T265_07314 [Opisthorchis viverrini]KER25212.1 hypothetical protein T265_07314 [Opisthorchis viverrini]